jgi:uncharacterized protein
MQFNVAQLLLEPIGASRHYHLDETYAVAEGKMERLRGELTLLRTDRGLLATGTLATRIDVSCSRCLAPVKLPVTLQIEEEYYPTVDALTGAPLPAPEEPTAFLIDEHHILDLSEAVRQALLLAEPMQPLCRPDCAGLCPTCGRDRNLGPCDCSAEPFDARWNALAGLLERRE